MLQNLDMNVLLFEILVHLDDQSVISLLSTCKSLYNGLTIDEYLKEKLALVDCQARRPIFDNCNLTDDQSLNNKIDELFKLAYLNFRNEMFTPGKVENFQGTVKVDQTYLYGGYKSQYSLLKKLIFKNGENIDNYTHHNRSVASSREGFWRSHWSNLIISKENTIYYWSVLLTKFDRKISNSWVILIGFSETDSASSLEQSWIRSGYCVKSNAKLECSDTSYQESMTNNEGDLVGIECYFQQDNIFFNVYLPSSEKHSLQFKSESTHCLSIVPMVSIVQSQSYQVVSILPWDGRVETLKRFGCKDQ